MKEADLRRLDADRSDEMGKRQPSLPIGEVKISEFGDTKH